MPIPHLTKRLTSVCGLPCRIAFTHLVLGSFLFATLAVGHVPAFAGGPFAEIREKIKNNRTGVWWTSPVTLHVLLGDEQYGIFMRHLDAMVGSESSSDPQAREALAGFTRIYGQIKQGSTKVSTEKMLELMGWYKLCLSSFKDIPNSMWQEAIRKAYGQSDILKWGSADTIITFALNHSYDVLDAGLGEYRQIAGLTWALLGDNLQLRPSEILSTDADAVDERVTPLFPAISTISLHGTAYVNGRRLGAQLFTQGGAPSGGDYIFAMCAEDPHYGNPDGLFEFDHFVSVYLVGLDTSGNPVEIPTVLLYAENAYKSVKQTTASGAYWRLTTLPQQCLKVGRYRLVFRIVNADGSSPDEVVMGPFRFGAPPSSAGSPGAPKPVVTLNPIPEPVNGVITVTGTATCSDPINSVALFVDGHGRGDTTSLNGTNYSISWTLKDGDICNEPHFVQSCALTDDTEGWSTTETKELPPPPVLGGVTVVASSASVGIGTPVTITAVVRDTALKGMRGQVVSFDVENMAGTFSGGSGAGNLEVTTDASGTARITFTGKEKGTATISATTQDGKTGSVNVTVVSRELKFAFGIRKAAGDATYSDYEITTRVTDAAGVPIRYGSRVNFTTTLGTIPDPTRNVDSDGVTKVHVTTTQAGTAVVTAKAMDDEVSSSASFDLVLGVLTTVISPSRSSQGALSGSAVGTLRLNSGGDYILASSTGVNYAQVWRTSDFQIDHLINTSRNYSSADIGPANDVAFTEDTDVRIVAWPGNVATEPWTNTSLEAARLIYVGSNPSSCITNRP